MWLNYFYYFILAHGSGYSWAEMGSLVYSSVNYTDYDLGWISLLSESTSLKIISNSSYHLISKTL